MPRFSPKTAHIAPLSMESQAFATTAAMESHVAIETGVLFALSPQELVSCMPNPDECGGTGGCAGATAELGFEYYIENGGVVQEYQMGCRFAE